MKTSAFLTAVLLSLSPLAPVRVARAQQEDAARLEVGGQFTSVALAEPAVKREVGAGGWLTYNLNNYFSLEASGNYLPSGSTAGFTPGGSITQMQFGVKAGKRWRRFGLFVKARPGFLSYDASYEPRLVGTQLINGVERPVYDLSRVVRTTHFSADVGGVVEIYPSRRLVTRFEAGDTVVRYGARNEITFTIPPFFSVPGRTAHNFQLSAGVGFRLRVPESGDDAGVPTRNARAPRPSVPKFEVGAHLTSLTFNAPQPISSSLVIFGENRPLSETGLGGRFTYNLTSHVGLESEINYFPTSEGIAHGAGGRIWQGQFGAKVGKRFRRFGLFAKVRPGFVGFTDTLVFVFSDENVRPVDIIEVRRGWKSYFSTDVGGVLELYVSRRVLTRFDLGDTVIRYTPYAVPPSSLLSPVNRRPQETRHNFQFNAGVGFRF